MIVVNLFSKFFGADNVISAVMHADEINVAATEELGKEVYHYHLHAMVLPVVEKEILWSKRCKDPVWLTVMYMFFVWIWLVVGFWAIWVILSVFVRFGTSTYFHKLLIAFFYAVLCLCTKKGTPQNIKWTERLDEETHI